MTAISFSNLNGGAKKSGVKYMKLVDGVNEFRILPDTVLPGYTYWVTGASGNQLPFDALQYDRANEKFDNSRSCPIRDLELKDAKGENLRCQWAYKCRVINKATGQVEILQLKKGILTDIIAVAQQLEVDPTSLDEGVWFSVTRKKTGPLPFNVEYNLQQLKCRPTKLEDEFLPLLEDLKPMDEVFPAETYDEQLARLKKHITGAKEDEQESTTESTQEAVDELSQ